MSLRADFTFPPRPFYPGDIETIYFEVTIKQPKEEPEGKPEGNESELPLPIISLGFCGEFCDLTQAHPGWNVWSVGYHGDNGAIYDPSSFGKKETGLQFGLGNTVGCGIDYVSEEYFFTRDGQIVGKSTSKAFDSVS